MQSKASEALDRIAAEFDHRDHESAYDPWGRWAALRDGPPLSRSEKYGGFQIASRYKTVCEIARNASVFSSHINQTTIPTMVSPPFPPINYDPPDHFFYRAILNPFFTPSKVKALEAWVETLAQKYVSQLVESDSFDVAAGLTIPLTREVVMGVMGINDVPSQVNQWADDLIFLNNEHEAAKSLSDFLAAEVAKRRVQAGDDVLSGLARATFRDRALSDDEISRMAMLLLLGGLDTTKSATNAAIWYLIQNPSAVDYLQAADHRSWDLAMDEFVRWASPAPAHARTARVDTEVEGCPVKAGERVMMLFGSANRDESEFENPDKVELDRFPNRHVGFGMGPHRCLGSHLAKVMMKAMLSNILPKLKDFQILSDDAIEWEAASVRGIRRLPLERKAALRAVSQTR